jgi:hypothetical protein
MTPQRPGRVAAFVVLATLTASCSFPPPSPADPKILPAMLADPIFQIDVPTGTPQGTVEGSGGSTGTWASPDIAFRSWTVSRPTQATFAAVLHEAAGLGMRFDSLSCGDGKEVVDFVAGGGKAMKGYAGSLTIGLSDNTLEVFAEISPDDPYPDPSKPKIKRAYDGSCREAVEGASGFSTAGGLHGSR